MVVPWHLGSESWGKVLDLPVPAERGGGTGVVLTGLCVCGRHATWEHSLAHARKAGSSPDRVLAAVRVLVGLCSHLCG